MTLYSATEPTETFEKSSFSLCSLWQKDFRKRSNARPTWLDLAHKKLDEAVFAAYGWENNLSDEEILSKLLELNLERAAKQ